MSTRSEVTMSQLRIHHFAMPEIWLPIPGYEGYCEVSSLGRVRSVARTIKNVVGNSYRYRERILKTRTRERFGRSYETIMLSREGGKGHFGVHQLVLLAFIGPRPNGMQACHNNGDGLDNRLGNLRWDTPRNNCADRELHQTVAHGERLRQKLTNEAAIAIANSTERSGILASRFSISTRTVQKIRKGLFWWRITGKTNPKRSQV